MIICRLIWIDLDVNCRLFNLISVVGKPTKIAQISDVDRKMQFLSSENTIAEISVTNHCEPITKLLLLNFFKLSRRTVYLRRAVSFSHYGSCCLKPFSQTRVQIFSYSTLEILHFKNNFSARINAVEKNISETDRSLLVSFNYMYFFILISQQIVSIVLFRMKGDGIPAAANFDHEHQLIGRLSQALANKYGESMTM